MGAEDFQSVVLTRGSDLCAMDVYLDSLPHVRRVDSVSEACCFEFYDEQHIVEFELDFREAGRVSRLSMRFALCQPESIDRVFVDLVREVASRFSAEVRICDPVGEGAPQRFEPPEYTGFEQTALPAIHVKRELWIQEFGPRRATLTCAEAIREFALQ